MKALGGIAPFGYRWRDGRLIIDEAEASVRKLMYELFLKHRRKKTVAKLLNDLGYRTRSASLFSDTTIDRLLRDSIAKGIREADGEIIEIEPLISSEMWGRVNNILNGGRIPKQSLQLFSGIAYCGCGGRMSVSSDTSKYVCADCRRKILASDLEAIFLSQFKEGSASENLIVYENWAYLSQKEKRTITEQICDRIEVCLDTINIQLGVSFLDSEPKGIYEGYSSMGQSLPETPTMATAEVRESLLSEAEAAKFLGISKMTVLRKRNAGEIGYFRIGSRILYSKEKHLLPFLGNREKGSAQP
jgi:excisionase family DNA binding protein